jgi:hypothetical protein
MSNRNPVPGQMPPGGYPPGAGQAPWNTGSYVASNFFVYECDLPAGVSLAAGGATQLTFNIAGDSDFFWTKFAAFALVGGAATTRTADQLPAVTALITNTTNSRQYSNAPVPLPNLAGTGVFPFILPQVTKWQAFATIQIQLANIGNEAYSNLCLSFHGIKAFNNSANSPGSPVG